MLKKLIANSDTYEKILITLIAQRDRCTTVEEMEFHEEIIDDYIEWGKLQWLTIIIMLTIYNGQ